MYSVVLMTALATGGTATDCHLFGGHGFGGFHGCYHGCYAGHGCYGGYGCYSGYGCYGCYGGGYRAYGHGYGSYGCHFGYGCYAGHCAGCWGCYSPYNPTTMPGVPVYPHQGDIQQGQPTPPQGEPVPNPKQADQEASARARLIVELPGDAKLFVDDNPTKSTSSRRVFVTPPLQQGQTYYYVLRAEMVKDGQPISVKGRVLVRPGQEINARLSGPSADATFLVQARNR